MPILYRYLIQEILRYIAMVLAVVVSIYLIVDFFEKIEKFMRAGLPMSRVITFFLFNMPFIIAQVFPVSVLLSILIVFGQMSRHHEIIALNSAGVSVYYLFKPLFFIGIFATVCLFCFSEGIVPMTKDIAEKIWRQEVRREAAVISKEKDLWIKDNHLIVNIRYYHPHEKTIFGIALNYFDESFNLVRKVDAKKGVFRDGIWVLSDLIEQTLNKKSGKYTVNIRDELKEPLKFMPDDLKQSVRQSQEMGFGELSEYIRKIEAEGYDATTYRVDLHAKIAFPFICLILCLIGTGISARANIREGLSLNIAFGIGVIFVYWIFYSFCLSLGYGEMIPPIAAAWTANLIFSCLGVFLLINAE